MKYALLVHVNKDTVDQFKDANAKATADTTNVVHRLIRTIPPARVSLISVFRAR